MITKYIKVPAYVFTEDSDDIKITRKFLRNNRCFEFVLNRKLLEYSVDEEAFMGRGAILLSDKTFKLLPRGTVRASDWMEWAHDDDGLDKIISITTVCFNIEDTLSAKKLEKLLLKGIDENIELKIYMYLKVEVKEELSKEETHNLLDYISGQLSDGWGENFSVDYDKYTTCLISDISKLKVVDEIYYSIFLH